MSIRNSMQKLYELEKLLDNPKENKNKIISLMSDKDNEGMTYLMSACKHNATIATKILKSEYCSKELLCMQDNTGMTCLMIACMSNPIIVPEILKSEYCSKELVNKKNDITCLTMAYQMSHTDIVEDIMKSKYCNIYTMRECLYLAIINNDLCIVSNIVRYGRKNVCDLDSVYIACQFGDLDMIKFIFTKVNKTQLTKLKSINFLNLVCIIYEIAEYILDFLDKNNLLKDLLIRTDNKTCLMVACIHDQKIVQLILNYLDKLCSKEEINKYISAVDVINKTALMYSCKNNENDILFDYIISKGHTNILENIISRDNTTYLIYAAKYNGPLCINLLQYFSKNKNMLFKTNDDKQNFLMVAIQYDNNVKEIIELLEKYNIDMFLMQDYENDTCLSYACQYNPKVITNILQSTFCSKELLSIKDIDGYTCLLTLCTQNYDSITKILDSEYFYEDLLLDTNNNDDNCLILACESGNNITVLLNYIDDKIANELILHQNDIGLNCLFEACENSENNNNAKIILDSKYCSKELLNQTAIGNYTCLMHACTYSPEIVTYILDSKYYSKELMQMKNEDNDTCLELACVYQGSIVKTLLQHPDISFGQITSIDIDDLSNRALNILNKYDNLNMNFLHGLAIFNPELLMDKEIIDLIDFDTFDKPDNNTDDIIYISVENDTNSSIYNTDYSLSDSELANSQLANSQLICENELSYDNESSCDDELEYDLSCENKLVCNNGLVSNKELTYNKNGNHFVYYFILNGYNICDIPSDYIQDRYAKSIYECYLKGLDSSTCSICLQNEVNILINCGHMICYVCSHQLQKKCPFCKKYIKSLIKLINFNCVKCDSKNINKIKGEDLYCENCSKEEGIQIYY